MNASLRVNLHCHSDCSDGGLSPDALAACLAADGVAFAALTDHDTVDGLSRFREALRWRGIGSVSGVEITSTWRGEDLHLLAYGFDPSHAGLLEALRGLRQARGTATQSVAGSLRSVGAASAGEPATRVVAARPEDRALSASSVIGLVHRAGGRVFLAHPLQARRELDALRPLLAELRACGLDGVEAYYAPEPPEAREAVARLADELGLLTSAGTDYHVDEDGRRNGIGIEIPYARWHPLREALRLEAVPSATRTTDAYRHARRVRRPFGRHVILPSFLAVGLFVGALWGLVLPGFERALLARKRELIRELTHAACSILADAERQVRAGRVGLEEAQREACERIAAMRYGHEDKDYFWIQDMRPRMIMHPYRTELNGQELTEYRDPTGARIFVEFAELVRRHHEGYVDYVWQWPDDPRRLEPKESYVKGFEPWGWVVGTGLYMEDVRHEIARLERGLIQASALITALVSLLLLYVVRHSRKVNRERAEAVEELHTANERYRSLVEAATEGTVLVLDGRCRYANPHLLSLLGYTAAELELLGLAEILPQEAVNEAVWRRVDALQRGEEHDAAPLAAELCLRDGKRVACSVAFSRVRYGRRIGLVLLARETLVRREAELHRPDGGDPLCEAAAQVPAGVFRAAADKQGTLLAANRIAARCLGAAAGVPGDGPRAVLSLSEAFREEAEGFARFRQRLEDDGKADCRLPSAPGPGPAATFALRATLERDGAGQPRAVNGLIEDITSQVRSEKETGAVIERLQAAQLFLHEPVKGVVKPGLFCPTDMPVARVAAALVERGMTAALVNDRAGETVGLVTMHDLCERVLAAGAASGVPVRAVMSAPLVTVSDDTPIYAALMRMREGGLHHLAVAGEDGRVVGTLSDRDLLPFQQYGAGALTDEIAKGARVEDVVRGCRRTAVTVQALLDSGAHPQRVTRLISSVCDAATERFVQLAVEGLGPPPAPFVFIALGSQGRQEQTLVTDQDNAIIYRASGQAADGSDAASYFQELGRRVCGWLNEAGYPFCRGRFMAQNPVWTRTLSAWKTHFSYWVSKAEPDELLIFSLFFDFRAVCGDADIVDELRRHVFADLRESPAFFPHFARDALGFKPPVTLFGRVLFGAARNTPKGAVDIKAAALPVVAFARLYALRHGVTQTGTLERLDALVEAGALTPASRDEAAATFNLLTRLRLQQQARCLHFGQAPDNIIHLRRLMFSERALLRQAFGHIRILQRRIAYDFLGGNPG